MSAVGSRLARITVASVLVAALWGCGSTDPDGLHDRSRPSFDIRTGDLLLSLRVRGRGRIYRVSESGAAHLLFNDGDAFDPRVSSDGRLVAFARATDHGTSDIWLMDADGRNPRQLTNSTGFDAQPIFVSSGIVFGRAATLRQTSTGGERWIDWDVFEVDTSGQQTARRTSSKFREIGSLDLMPDGKHILVSTMEISNSVDYSLNILELSSGRRTTVGVPGDFHGSVSVNGRIAFIHDTGDYNYEVFMMDADGQNRQQITHLKSYIAAPIVSPDTKRVAFLSDKTRQGIYLLWEARLDGNELYPRQIELPE